MRDIGVDIRVVGLFTLAQAPWAFKVRVVAADGPLRAAVLGTAARVDGGHADRARRARPAARRRRAPPRCDLGGRRAGARPSRSRRRRRTSRSTPTRSRCCARKSRARRSARASRSTAPRWSCRAAPPSRRRRASAGRRSTSLLALALPADAPPHVEGAGARGARRRRPRRCAMRSGSRSSGFLARHRALEILAFVLLYKFADQLTQALTRPFLIDMGYNADHRGIALATVGLVATIVGAFVGGWVTTLVGLGHSLWIFGFLQIFSNIGYYFVSLAGGPEPAADVRRHELRAPHVGPGHGRVLGAAAAHDAEAVLGHAVRAVLEPVRAAAPARRARSPGSPSTRWAGPTFFLSTMVMGIPGLVMLARFVPLGVREPVFTVEEIAPKPPLGARQIAMRGVAGRRRRRRDRVRARRRARRREDDAGRRRAAGFDLGAAHVAAGASRDDHRLGARSAAWRRSPSSAACSSRRSSRPARRRRNSATQARYDSRGPADRPPPRPGHPACCIGLYDRASAVRADRSSRRSNGLWRRRLGARPGPARPAGEAAARQRRRSRRPTRPPKPAADQAAKPASEPASNLGPDAKALRDASSSPIRTSRSRRCAR